MSRNRDVVERFLRATADADADAAVALCTEDVVYEIVSLDTYHGHDGVRTFVADQSSLVAVHRELRRIVEDENDVAVERLDTFVFGEGTVDMPTGAFFSLREGRIRRWVDYQDLRAVAHALGH